MCPALFLMRTVLEGSTQPAFGELYGKPGSDLIIDGGVDMSGPGTIEDFLHSMLGLGDQAGSARILPLYRALPIPDLGVDVVFLHERQGLVMPQVVAGSIEAYASHGFKRKGFVIHLDPSKRPVDGSEHVVVNHETLKATTEQARVHSR